MELLWRYIGPGGGLLLTRSAEIPERDRRCEELPNDTNELPNEIWTKILELVGEGDLLTCRQVNRLWHSIITPICRRRFFRINFSRLLKDPNFTSFYSTFKNCNDLPWSAFKLHLELSTEYKCHSSSIQIREFIHLFGMDIQELTLSGNCKEQLIFTMNGVPNITYLDIRYINIKEPIQESFTAHLGKLKGLIASISNDLTFRFFKLILNRPEVQLRFLKLIIQLDGDWRTESGDILSTLITGIPTLHVELRRVVPELITQLARNMVQVHQLKIHLDAPLRVTLPEFHSSLEEFLENTADTLRKLTLIQDDRWETELNSRLTIPTLPQLSYLEVNAEGGREKPVLYNVTHFTSSQFPRLDKVSTHFNSRSGRITLFGAGQLDTVTELVLTGINSEWFYFLDMDWERIFPNLKSLDLYIFQHGLELIFAKFKKLERLFLVHDRPSHLEQGEWETAFLLSLITCTGLKEFKLVLDSQHTMSDAFVDSFLLKIAPLDYLCLENVVISDEQKDKLQRYHSKAEIYEAINPDRNKNISVFEEMR